MAHLTIDKRIEVVLTFERTQSISSTSKQCKVSRAAVRHWVSRFKTNGTVNTKSRTGQNTVVSEDAAVEALQLFRTNENVKPEDVARVLYDKQLCNTIVHKTTIIRRVKLAAENVGLKVWASKGLPCKALTPQTKAKRLNFAQTNKNRNWDNVIFTDRVKLKLEFPGSRVQRSVWLVGPRNGATRPAVFKPNHPMCLNVYGGITKWGSTAFHIVAGTTKHKSAFQTKKGIQSKNITASEYGQVLHNTILPEAKAIFGRRGINTFYVMQDNDPAHHKGPDIVEAWGRAHGCTVHVLPNWPPNSPDLNPIENVWGWLQDQINKLGCTTFQEFKEQACTLFATIPKPMLIHAYNHMHERMLQVIHYQGDKTPH